MFEAMGSPFQGGGHKLRPKEVTASTAGFPNGLTWDWVKTSKNAWNLGDEDDEHPFLSQRHVGV